MGGFALRLFWTIAAVGLVLGMKMFLSSSRSGQRDPPLETMFLVERSVRFLQACWLIVLILFMSRLGLTWQYYAVGIATGFGAFSASYLVLLELHAHLHLIAEETLRLLNSAAYNVAIVIWAVYFVPRRLKTGIVVASLPTAEISRWNEALSRYLNE